MSFEEFVELIRDYWAEIVVLSVMIAAALFGILRWLFKNRIEEAVSAKRNLESELESLKRQSSAATKGAGARGATAEGPIPVATESDVLAAWPRTNEQSQKNLLELLRSAKRRITVFGLTRNFYVCDELRPLILARSQEVPVVFFLMDPDCDSRRDRYRIEPIEAALEDPERYEREVEKPFKEMLRATPRTEAGSNVPGLAVYYFNFPCSFAIEEIDDRIRVMLYGHAKRGTEGPIFLLNKGSRLAAYFESQLRWLEDQVAQGVHAPWSDKGIVIKPME